MNDRDIIEALADELERVAKASRDTSEDICEECWTGFLIVEPDVTLVQVARMRVAELDRAAIEELPE